MASSSAGPSGALGSAAFAAAFTRSLPTWAPGSARRSPTPIAVPPVARVRSIPRTPQRGASPSPRSSGAMMIVSSSTMRAASACLMIWPPPITWTWLSPANLTGTDHGLFEAAREVETTPVGLVEGPVGHDDARDRAMGSSHPSGLPPRRCPCRRSRRHWRPWPPPATPCQLRSAPHVEGPRRSTGRRTPRSAVALRRCRAHDRVRRWDRRRNRRSRS